jgi:hypothetical protein
VSRGRFCAEYSHGILSAAAAARPTTVGKKLYGVMRAFYVVHIHRHGLLQQRRRLRAAQTRVTVRINAGDGTDKCG